MIPNKPMINVITYGTFDLFHIGHLRLLQRAKAMGDRLIVGVSTDRFNKIKQKLAIYPYAHRKNIVQSIKYVTQVIPENTWEQKRADIKKYNIHILVMGSDWKGKFDDLNDICKVIYIPRTKRISASGIKRKIKTLQPLCG